MLFARPLIVTVLACLGLAAAAAPDTVYTNAKYRFSLTPPPGWVSRPHPDAVAIFMEPNGERAPARIGSESNREFIERINRKLKETTTVGPSFRSNLTITAVKVLPGTTVEKYARDTRARFEGSQIYRVLGEKPAKADGLQAVLRTMRAEMPDSGSVRIREVIVVRGDSALSFALAASPDSFARHAAEFDRTMASLRWKQ